MGTRELLAAVLGVGFGLFLIAFPEAFANAQLTGRYPTDEREGHDHDSNGPSPWWARQFGRVIGLLFVAGGLYFGAREFGLL